MSMKKNGSAPVANPQAQSAYQEEEPMVGSIEYLNEQAFGAYDPSLDESRKGWNPEDEMARIKNGISDELIEKSNLPEYLKESFRSNPAIDAEYADSVMNEMENKISERTGGFNAAKRIIESVEDKDRKNSKLRTLSEEARNQPTGIRSDVIDYSMIREIVEEAVKRNLSQLNESGGNGMKTIKLKPGDKFIFLDDNHNVYEAEIKYKGKSKVKSK